MKSNCGGFIVGNRWIKTTGLEKEKLIAVLESQDILRGTGIP